MGVPVQDGDLLIALGQRDVELHQEAIELGFGQLIRALVFDGILGGRNDERIGQRTRGAIDGDLTFLHGLQQCCLCLRRGPVDLVGEQQVGEYRASAELERRGACVVDQGAGDVARHEVGGELYTLEVEGQCGRECAHQKGFGDTGHTLQEHVAAAQQCDNQAADHRVLSDDHGGYLFTQCGQGVAGGLPGTPGGSCLCHDSRTCLSRTSSC